MRRNPGARIRAPRPVAAAVSSAAALVLLLAGCGGNGPGPDTGADAPPGFPVTLDNCGERTMFDAPPERAVSLNQHATEVMLALGLEESMVGTAYLDDSILPEYQDAYDSVEVLAEEYPSYEAILAAEPDYVYGGFASTFEEGRGREAFAGLGIGTRLNLEECAAGPVTVDLMDREIREVARTFGVEDRAEDLLAGLHATLDTVAEQLHGVEPLDVFVYDSGESTAFTAGGAGIGNEMIELAGGVNIFADLDKTFGDVSFEQVAARAPDVIVIYDYGDQPVEDKREFLLSHPALQHVPAIQEERFAVLPCLLYSFDSSDSGVSAPPRYHSCL
ncbi:ABC transporter substrate-binding protein [Streptomyces specialis]|uniref:ABC transporter substrate-binding protein n=1 Tax=Streptomyces specialis TaxID=498367 RepID=UPI00099F2626|nr:ABC transporter substrate-binding protein [Streptomyces specialis]